MSSTAANEIELLERVLFRLGSADTDEKLEATVDRFLTPVILKLTSQHSNVRDKVVEVLTHIKRRLQARPLVQIPVEALLDQYKAAGDSPFLQNFAIIFITMGFPRLPNEKSGALAPKVISCEKKPGNYQDKLLMLLIPILGQMNLSDDPAKRRAEMGLDNNNVVRRNFLSLLQDVFLLPYGITPEHAVAPGMSEKSFKRLIVNQWKAEELEKIKQGIVRFVCSGVFHDAEIFLPLVVASADTRFSVASPAIAEVSKISTMLDFTEPRIATPLYNLFLGDRSSDPKTKTTPCCARVRQKVLQFLIRCRGRGLDVPRGMQVIFEGLFGDTSQKCKVLALKFAENMIQDGSYQIVSKVAKVILNGLSKVIGRESEETNDVQNAAYTAIAQLARSYPNIISQDLKIVLTYFNNLAVAPPDLHSSIREALVSMAPAFTWKTQQPKEKDADPELVHLDGQQHLLLAMLSDNAESKLHIVQNVTSVFLTTCYPEFYAPARYLLLLIAGEHNSLRENVTTYLYGVSNKDHINYNTLFSIEHPGEKYTYDMYGNEETNLILPSFRRMMQHVNNMSRKRIEKNMTVAVGNTKLPYTLEVYEEILEYLRICLWYSAGVTSAPGEEKYAHKLKEYVEENYEDSENNELYQYLQFVQRSVEAKRSATNLTCLYDLLNAAPVTMTKSQMHLLEPLANSLKDVKDVMRKNVAQVYGILMAYGYEDKEFNDKIAEILAGLSQKSLEHKHGWLLVIGHAFGRRISSFKEPRDDNYYCQWTQFVEAIKIIAKMLCETQWLLLLAAVNCISMIGKTVKIPNVDVEIQVPKNNDDDDEEMKEYETQTASTKSIIFAVVFSILRGTSVRAKIREEAARCLGYLAVGDGEYFTQRNLDKFLSLVKVQKDAALNIAISEAIASTLCGYDVNFGTPTENFKENIYCTDEAFEKFVNSLIALVTEPNPHARQSISVWLLGVVKHCNHRPSVLKRKKLIQFAFTELVSDENEFVQDVASRGLSLVYSLSDATSQQDLANTLLDQLLGTKKKVNKVSSDTELFAQGMLGKTPTGGNITTYKELCSLASDLNQPDMIYQFMQLANDNASWTSKLGAAFGFMSLSKDAQAKMEPYLGKIIPRIYRYKYDPTPKIQHSMMTIWQTVVPDPKVAVETYYWQILRELIDNLTHTEWRVRISCCLAVRDILKRPTGLRLRTDERKLQELKRGLLSPMSKPIPILAEGIPEPELHELWVQLFRVMDDIHEGTRLAAEGTVKQLSKLCVIAASAERGISGKAVATSILPFILETGVTHTVPEIRKISINTISEMIDSSGKLIAPHLPSLIPCLLKATGELESTKLSYLSTRLGADNDAQEVVDTLRAEAAKSHHTMDTISKCVTFIDYPALEKMSPAVQELIKTSVNLGSKIASAHFVCLVSIRIGKEMQPLVGKYLAACFVALKDRNATVRKYNASAIGHLMGIAKEQSVKNLFTKLDELYMENSSNRGIALTIQSINKRHHELLKDYIENVLPLVFFAMHEEQTEENKSNLELWKDLWNDISLGDAGIRLNLHAIIPKLEKSLNDDSWLRKAQAANAIQTIATRLSSTLEETDRVRLINLLLTGLQGRTFQGKERLLQALAALCKNLNREHEICERVIEAAMRECRKQEPIYRTSALGALGDILEQLEVDRFEEIYNMIWYLLDKKDMRRSQNSDDEYESLVTDSEKDLSADERNKRAQIVNKLKETVCETLGKSWPKNATETQHKFQLLFAKRCSDCLRECTRPVQVSLMVALTKFIERLCILNKNAKMGNVCIVSTPEMEYNKEKKAKVEKPETPETIVEHICNDVLSAVTYAAGLPHTGLKKESLNIVLMLVKRLSEAEDTKTLGIVKRIFEENLEKFQKDSAPEVRCRVKDIEEKLAKLSV